MDQQLVATLKHLGVSKKQAAVYVAALEIAPATAGEIALKSGVNRATTYLVIEQLKELGLISTFIKDRRQFFVAETPERLRTFLDRERKRIDVRDRELDQILPMLLALHNADNTKPQIRYLEGVEGNVTVRRLFDTLKGEYIQLYCFEDVQKNVQMHESQKEHVARLRAQMVCYRALVVTKDREFSHQFKLPGGEVRLVPYATFPIHGEITVRADTIFLYTYAQGMLSIVIKSQSIADTLRGLFDLAWQGAASYPRQIPKG